MTHSNDPGGQRWRRRLVLGAALALALVVGLPRVAAPVDAAPAPAIAAAPEANAPATAERAAPAAPDTSTAKPAASGADQADVTISPRGIIVGKGGRGVSVRGLGSEHEYDSFEEFVNDAPWLAALVFFAVLMVFLTPLLIVVLFIWYKIRKTRMQNETMLRLAEKGVVAPAEAMQSVVGGSPASQSLPPSAAPLYEQARLLRKRAAWSDLRKGVMFIAVGLGFIFYSMLADGEANWLGLTCFFVGAGFCFLWFFEERQAPAKGDPGAPPTSSA